MKHNHFKINYINFFVIFTIIAVSSCKTRELSVIELPVEIKTEQALPYKPSDKRKIDIIHTKLSVSFNWNNRTMDGTAELLLKPFFKAERACTLDAKGMLVKSVYDLDREQNLPFINDELKLIIDLKKEFKRTDTLNIKIEYTAKPEELKTKTGRAISSDKGLYFINHDGKDRFKPKQIWTHGEPESNSVWFPTIDSPNERMTQEIAITVEDQFTTLSNGLLMFSEENGDGTRTDYWEQRTPAAPYLTMMAIGEYSVVKDKWKSIDVNYYVEPNYEKFAKQIFGKTPEMLSFFSEKFGVDYPWEKCSQVVVRDFVSGAMENTGAIVYGEFVQKNPNQLMDRNYEDFLSHELAHQWFGDLVTCESWSNIPLNESFATYGEYLWNEYKYGVDEADYYGMQDLYAYLNESVTKQVDLIRYHYDEIDELFDAHSYQKGGRILHYLRHYLGDDAFFESLKLYLTKHAYQSVEVHDLRLAFEAVSGEDLNWFFDDWFFNSGHPNIFLNYSYDSLSNFQSVVIEQMHSNETPLIYKLPIDIVLSVNNSIEKHRVILSESKQEFKFKTLSRPEMVLVDPGWHIPGVLYDYKNFEAYTYQFYQSPHYLGRLRALDSLAYKIDYSDKAQLNIVVDASRDPFWDIRFRSIELLQYMAESDSAQAVKILTNLALKDKYSKVRAEAIYALGDTYKGSMALLPVYKAAIEDSSYLVLEEALTNYTALDSEKGLTIARALSKDETLDMISVVSRILALHGNHTDHEFFINGMRKTSGIDKLEMVTYYGIFLKNNLNDALVKGIPYLQVVGITGNPWWVRSAAMNALLDINRTIEAKLNSDNVTDSEKEEMQKNKTSIEQAIEQIKKEEKEPRLINRYNID